MIRVYQGHAVMHSIVFACVCLTQKCLCRIMQDPYFLVSDLVAFANDLSVLSLQNSGISWFPVAFACFSLCFPGGSLAILWCHHLGVLRVDLDFINVYPSVAGPERASPVHAAGLLPRHVAGCGLRNLLSMFHPISIPK